MNSLTLTLSPSTRDGVVGYTVRIVTTGPLATASMSADTQILRALSSTLGTPDLSPPITWTTADVSLFLPASLVTDPTTFADTLTKKLTGVRTPVTVPQPPVVMVVAPTVKKAAPPPKKSLPVGCRPGGAAAGAASIPYVPPSDYDMEMLLKEVSALRHTHGASVPAVLMPDADEDDLEVEMDPDFCLCITQAGTQCSRRPAKGKSVCAQHGRKKR